ncbi:unnamed protein product, partial [Urochloa humidicola]
AAQASRRGGARGVRRDPRRRRGGAGARGSSCWRQRQARARAGSREEQRRPELADQAVRAAADLRSFLKVTRRPTAEEMQPCLSPSLGGAALDVHARMAMASDSDSDARNGGGSESGSKTPSASPSVTRTPTAASPGSVAGVYSSGRRRARAWGDARSQRHGGACGSM